MAGFVPKRPASGRKQWTLHDGPAGSLNRLRNQLASDGCAESQLVLAKRLLEEECDVEEESKENARLGVHWLIKASQQGHLEAIDLLKECFITGRGITDANMLIVKACLDMRQDERLAKYAAHQIVLSLLTTSPGGSATNTLTTSKLRQRMREIDTPTSNTQAETAVAAPDRQIAEEDLVVAAIDCHNGRLPHLNQLVCVLNTIETVPYLHRPFLYPFQTLLGLYEQCVKLFAASRVAPTILLCALLIGIISFSLEIVQFSLSFLHFTALGLMFLYTCQLLVVQRNFSDFRLWSGILVRYTDGNFNAPQAEWRYIRRNIITYANFFIVFTVVILTCPKNGTTSASSCEVAFLAALLAVITFTSTIVSQKNWTDCGVLVFSLLVNCAAKYPFDVKSLTYFAGPTVLQICHDYSLVMYVICGTMSFVWMAAQDQWRGTFKRLLPHCLTLCWLQLTLFLTHDITDSTILLSGFVHGTFFVLALILFVPFLGITTVIVPFVTYSKWLLTESELWYSIVFGSLTVTVCWWCLKYGYTRIVTGIQICCMILALLPFSSHVTKIPSIIFNPTGPTETSTSTLTWLDYETICHPPLTTDNLAVIQMKCSDLSEMSIQWDGYVTKIQLLKRHNVWHTILSYVPSVRVRNWLQCQLSTYWNQCHMSTSDVCSLCHFDVYTFGITVKKSPISIWERNDLNMMLVTSHDFVNFTMRLRTNDNIWFKGTLKTFDWSLVHFNGQMLFVDVDEVGCLTCDNSELSQWKTKVSKTSVLSTLSLSNFMYTVVDGLKTNSDDADERNDKNGFGPNFHPTIRYYQWQIK